MSRLCHKPSAFRAACAALVLVVPGCHRDMHDQPRYDTLEASDFFVDGKSARPPVEGTIARGQLHQDESFHTGKVRGAFVLEPPVDITRALLERGEERFNIYCAVCHARTGEGDGMIVQRGFRRPPSLHMDRLRNAPAGHFFDVMTNGFGAMPSYKVQVSAADRWAITAYIRVLQLSRSATLDDVPANERSALQEQAQ
jgi:mono/diheme cytochrome c family protein